MEPSLLEDGSDIATEEIFEHASGDDIYHYEDDLRTSKKASQSKSNPGHHGFIPIKELTRDGLIEQLPRELLTDESERVFNIVEFIKTAADTVVHIDASKVSTERPEHFPHYKRRGKSDPRAGSGWVSSIYLCGQPRQGAEVEAEVIEKYLMKYKLSKLQSTFENMRVLMCTPFGVPFNYPPRRGNNLRKTIDCLATCIALWIRNNLRKSVRQDPKDDFSERLIRHIAACYCKDCPDEGHDCSYICKKCNETLNSFREKEGLSVLEFCMAISRGLGPGRSESGIRAYWENMSPYLDKPCPCHDCAKNGNPKKKWWMVEVTTAAHVVFDDQEVESAKVTLFYDDTVKPQEFISGFKVLKSFDGHPTAGDYVTFLCALHDNTSGSRLKTQKEKIGQFCPHAASTSGTVVISHPHGSSKHVTLGTKIQVFGKVAYITPTCPGSSGGLVLAFDSGAPLTTLHSKTVQKKRSGRRYGCGGYPGDMWTPAGAWNYVEPESKVRMPLSDEELLNVV